MMEYSELSTLFSPINRCQYRGCSLIFESNHDLNEHIENVHIDWNFTPIIIGKIQKHPCLPMSLVLPYCNQFRSQYTDSLSITKCCTSKSSNFEITQPINYANIPVIKKTVDVTPASSIDAFITEPLYEPNNNVLVSKEPEVSTTSTIRWIKEADSFFDSTKKKNRFFKRCNTDRPYHCGVPGCKKTYKNINGIKYHIKNGHKIGMGTEYHCNDCARSYRTAQGLKNHLRTHKPSYQSGDTTLIKKEPINIETLESFKDMKCFKKPSFQSIKQDYQSDEESRETAANFKRNIFGTKDKYTSQYITNRTIPEEKCKREIFTINNNQNYFTDANNIFNDILEQNCKETFPNEQENLTIFQQQNNLPYLDNTIGLTKESIKKESKKQNILQENLSNQPLVVDKYIPPKLYQSQEEIQNNPVISPAIQQEPFYLQNQTQSSILDQMIEPNNETLDMHQFNTQKLQPEMQINLESVIKQEPVDFEQSNSEKHFDHQEEIKINIKQEFYPSEMIDLNQVIPQKHLNPQEKMPANLDIIKQEVLVDDQTIPQEPFHSDEHIQLNRNKMIKLDISAENQPLLSQNFFHSRENTPVKQVDNIKQDISSTELIKVDQTVTQEFMHPQEKSKLHSKRKQSFSDTRNDTFYKSSDVNPQESIEIQQETIKEDNDGINSDKNTNKVVTIQENNLKQNVTHRNELENVFFIKNQDVSIQQEDITKSKPVLAQIDSSACQIDQVTNLKLLFPSLKSITSDQIKKIRPKPDNSLLKLNQTDSNRILCSSNSTKSILTPSVEWNPNIPAKPVLNHELFSVYDLKLSKTKSNLENHPATVIKQEVNDENNRVAKEEIRNLCARERFILPKSNTMIKPEILCATKMKKYPRKILAKPEPETIDLTDDSTEVMPARKLYSYPHKIYSGPNDFIKLGSKAEAAVLPTKKTKNVTKTSGRPAKRFKTAKEMRPFDFFADFKKDSTPTTGPSCVNTNDNMKTKGNRQYFWVLKE